MKKLLLMQIGYFDNCIQEKRRKEMLNRQMQIVVLIVVVMVMVCILPPSAIAAVDNYSGDQAGFQSAIAGLSQQTFNFDELSEGDAITDQYLPWVSSRPDPAPTSLRKLTRTGAIPRRGFGVQKCRWVSSLSRVFLKCILTISQHKGSVSGCWTCNQATL